MLHLFGEHPTNDQVNAYFGVMLALHTYSNYTILKSGKYRQFWMWFENITVGMVHYKAVTTNKSNGIQMEVNF